MSTQDLFRLDGKVALVTGGAGWLGSAMSAALAEAGAHVVVTDISEDVLEEKLAAFRGAGLDVSGQCTDTITEEPLRACIRKVGEDRQRLDVLVNCAYYTPHALVDEVTGEQMQTAFAAATAYTVAAQEAARLMRQVGGGSIVNIGSMYGSVTGYPDVYEGVTPPNPVTYQASKAAVHQITKHLAVYWAQEHIRVNTLSPGPIPDKDKPLYRDKPEFQEFIRRLEDRVPMKRIGRPDEFRGPVVFLASEASSYITGQNLLVDGGWTVW